MTRFDARTEGPAWDALRAATSRLGALAARDHVNLLELGKAYAAIADAMLAAARAAGQTSLRFEVAAKALDLKTPKSALTAFLHEG